MGTHRGNTTTRRWRGASALFAFLFAASLTSCSWLQNEAFVYNVAPPPPPTESFIFDAQQW